MRRPPGQRSTRKGAGKQTGVMYTPGHTRIHGLAFFVSHPLLHLCLAGVS